MKKTIMAMAIATAASGSASAADLPRGPAPYYPPPSLAYNWTGPYAGLNLGYEWGKVTNNVTKPSGIAGGGQIGYNWQMSQFVFGVETDIQISGADDTSPDDVRAMIRVLRCGACDDVPRPDASSTTDPITLYAVAGCVLDRMRRVVLGAPW